MSCSQIPPYLVTLSKSTDTKMIPLINCVPNVCVDQTCGLHRNPFPRPESVSSLTGELELVALLRGVGRVTVYFR